jgi:outer membrane receptor protein involved in Fe transport
MTTRRLTSLLLLSTALTVPALARAADLQDAAPAQALSAADAASDAQTRTAPDISIPGVSEVVVIARSNSNITQVGSQVVSVLSNVEIQRTGEGNIAGALSRVTGLSLVGSGYVYVRGLGDRYSLALLNGSPLPSPEPLKRVVPLDLFPSSMIASTLVQKSYSANFPGEFGGGVINLTTRAIPTESFFSLGGSVGGDTETTGHLGYTYYGSRSDWSGYDNGARDTPPALAAFLASGQRISSGKVDTAAIASELVNGRNAVLQRFGEMPANFSLGVSAGRPFELGDVSLGVIAAGGYSNRWVSRETVNQTSLQGDLADLESDFRRVTTDNRLVFNGLFGVGADFGANRLRWTNVYVHDTVKHSRLGIGNRHGTDVDYQQQDTAWFERQLLNSQIVGEFKPTENLSLDARLSRAISKRDAPAELSFEYVRTNTSADPYGAYFINRLNNGNRGDATISYSALEEKLWSGGLDGTYRFAPSLAATIGYAYSDTNRESSRRDFQFQAPNTFPGGVDMLRPDYLLAPGIIKNFGVILVDTNEGNPAFLAKLRNHAAYAKLNGQVFDSLQFDFGVRYETAKETVAPIQVFTTPGASLAATDLDKSYWLPAATLTWEFAQDMQLRASASKTIARPQFRELIYQFYFDPESNRSYRGNPLLTDSELTNAEARYEWYFARGQRLTAAAFYKNIEKPIEAYVVGESFTTSYANAPKAELYGLEAEAVKNFDLSGWSGDFWSSRELVAVANYTYTTSKLTVGPDDEVHAFAVSSTKATDFFRDGSPMTGQSDHILNLELSLENTDHLSQQTLLINYASERVTSRGLANTGQPDVFEYPGVRIDFVARQGVEIAGREVEFKFEARNLTGQKYEEYQSASGNRVDINTYKVGRSFTLTTQVRF